MHTLKQYSCCLFLLLFFISGLAQQIQPSNKNYVMAIQAQEPFKTAHQLEAAPLDQKITNITYYDGLGRPKQQIAVGASPMLSSTATNNFVSMDWELGDGSTPFFNQNGQTSENQRILGTDPTGAKSLLWKCGNDAANDADGGWTTDYFDIDNTVGYRYSVWVKRTGSQDGRTYHGPFNVNTLDGKEDNNPYFWYGALPELDTWYLMVGVVHPHDYTEPDQGISGVYDINGNRVLDGKEFKWRSNVHTSRFRSYLFYSTDTNVRQYFWNPTIQKLDGTEQDITGVSLFTRTNELTMDWISGNGGTPFFNQNGQASENRREYGDNPHGLRTVLWKCGNDAARDADGGWNTDYFVVDNTVEYRYSVWVKRTGALNGSTYHGTQNVEDLNGIAQDNPYFWYGDLPKLDTWYQLRGVIHPQGYTGGDKGISGVYDIQGNKVIDGTEFRWSITTTRSRFRSYLYYSTDTSVHQYFWGPLVRKLGGEVTPNIITDYEGTISRGNDIITHIEYDLYGRQAKKYLPFTSNGTNGSYRKVNKNYDINGYYLKKYSDDFPGITNPAQVNAYSETVYEASPLNRVTEQGAPGKDWKANPNSDTDHTIKLDWKTNTANEVVRFEVTFENNDTEKPKLVKSATNYAAGQLYVTITKDENWQPDQTHLNDHTTKEYTDKLGRVILKRTYASTGSANSVAHDTYYIYDNYDNLTYVLPPKVDTSDGVSNTELVEVCYQYKYDYRNRLIEKKIPGKGWEYIVYNKLDQPVMTQDANQRAKKEWLFTKYDAFGRVVYTGKIMDNKDRTTLQSEVNAYAENLWVERTSAASIGGVTMYYSDGGYPKVSTGEVLTINYYDDYRFLAHEDAVFNNPTTVYNEPISNNTKSLATGAKVKVLGTSYWTTTATYYDKKARPIYVASSNKEFLETTDIVATKLDFIGRVEETTTTHTKGSYATIKTVDVFTYDHMGRIVTQTQKINDQAEELITANEYDELGQLTNKKVGGTVTASGSAAVSSLQQINYKYNIRGWLKGINDTNTLGNDLFGFALEYNSGANPLYNGNISKTSWQTANDNVNRSYTYTYDALNRILSATSNDGNYNLSNVSYNKMGGILSLTRTGWQNSGNFADMDVLSYEYDAGNKPMKITDTGNKAYGFKDGTNTGDDFKYDANGSRILDRNKGITGITYNHFNLPTQINVSNTDHTGNIKLIYDANGVKLRKQATENGDTVTTDYSGNHIYENGVLKSIKHPEGYIEPENDGTYSYVYQYKDHVQNVRLSYSDRDGNGSITTDEILEENSYYPFGGKHAGYNIMIRSTSPALRFKFANMELNKELGLSMYDFGARQMDEWDPTWWQIDPKAELMRRHSPYNYAFDNPIYYMDPDGMMACEGGDCPENDLVKGSPAQVVRKQVVVAAKAVGKVLGKINDYLKTKGGGFNFTSKNGGGEDPGRKGDRKTETVNADHIMQAAGMGGSKKSGIKPKVTTKNVLKVIKTTKSGMGTGKKMADKGMEIANKLDQDTTVTAEFADKIIETKGTAIIHSRRDSTATVNKKDVSSFNKQAENSIQQQEQKVDQLLENRN